MEPPEIYAEEFAPLLTAFREQLIACLEECAHGRRGLFAEPPPTEENDAGWPEASRLRELAGALQALLAQSEIRPGESNALVEEFLDLCTMHGESHPGEPRLAREFLKRIERGEVGTPTQPEQRFR